MTAIITCWCQKSCYPVLVRYTERKEKRGKLGEERTLVGRRNWTRGRTPQQSEQGTSWSSLISQAMLVATTAVSTSSSSSGGPAGCAAESPASASPAPVSAFQKRREAPRVDADIFSSSTIWTWVAWLQPRSFLRRMRWATSLHLARSMTFEYWPIHWMTESGVTSTKQSPLFTDDATGSTNRVCTCRRPDSFVWRQQFRLPFFLHFEWVQLNRKERGRVKLKCNAMNDGKKIIQVSAEWTRLNNKSAEPLMWRRWTKDCAVSLCVDFRATAVKSSRLASPAKASTAKCDPLAICFNQSWANWWIKLGKTMPSNEKDKN